MARLLTSWNLFNEKWDLYSGIHMPMCNMETINLFPLPRSFTSERKQLLLSTEGGQCHFPIAKTQICQILGKNPSTWKTERGVGRTRRRSVKSWVGAWREPVGISCSFCLPLQKKKGASSETGWGRFEAKAMDCSGNPCLRMLWVLEGDGDTRGQSERRSTVRVTTQTEITSGAGSPWTTDGFEGVC